MGNYITGSKLQTLIVVMHKAFLIAVEKIRALSSYGLGNEEAFTVLSVRKCSRMELDIA